VLEKKVPAMVNRSFFNEDDVVSLFCKSKTGGMAAGFDIVEASIMLGFTSCWHNNREWLIERICCV
jgi:hypothetical protein